jgi:hypothetical protein
MGAAGSHLPLPALDDELHGRQGWHEDHPRYVHTTLIHNYGKEITMPKINTEPVTYIKAQVQSAQPDRTQYQPYKTVLTFEGKVFIEVPVPRSEVENGKDGEIILTLAGWTAFLNNYAKAVEDMNAEHLHSYMR